MTDDKVIIFKGNVSVFKYALSLICCAVGILVAIFLNNVHGVIILLLVGLPMVFNYFRSRNMSAFEFHENRVAVLSVPMMVLYKDIKKIFKTDEKTYSFVIERENKETRDVTVSLAMLSDEKKEEVVHLLKECTGLAILTER